MKRALAVMLVLVLSSGLLACSGSGADSSAKLDSYAADAKVFNSDESVTSQFQSLMLNKQLGTIYASIGDAADYPDQVLVTVSIPSMNYAQQFLFDPNNPTQGLGQREVDFDTL